MAQRVGADNTPMPRSPTSQESGNIIAADTTS